jgi:hypothetical protein
MRHLIGKRRLRVALGGFAAVAALAGVAVATDSFALVSTYSAVVKFVGLNDDGSANSPIGVNSTSQGGLSYGNYGIGIGDFDNDGFDDYLAGGINPSTGLTAIDLHRGLSADGSSYASGVRLANVGGWNYYVMDFAVADYNHDGNLDFEVNDYNGRSVRVYLGNGDGTFRVGPAYPIPMYAMGADAADVNNDGNADFVVGALGRDQYCYVYPNGSAGSCDHSSITKQYAVFLGNGNGSFTRSVIELRASVPNTNLFPFNNTFFYSEETWGIALADFDGDGNVDIASDLMNGVVHNQLLVVFPGNGDGTFGTGIKSGGPWTSTYSYYTYASLDNEDINHDGVQDLVATPINYPYGVSTYLGRGDGTFALASTRTTSDQFTGISTRPSDTASDRRAPVATIDTTSHLTNVVAVNVTGSATDAGGIATVELVRNDVVIATVSPGTNGALSASITLVEGDNNLKWRATDRAGNVGESPVVVVTLDSIKPTVALTDVPQYATSPNFILNGVAADERELATVDIYVNGAKVSTVTSGDIHAAVNLIPGTNTLGLVATDEAGNTRGAEARIILDTAGPELALNALPEFTNHAAQTVAGTVHDIEGVDHLELLVGGAHVGGSFAPDASGAFHVAVTLAEGDNSIAVVAYDVAGLQTTAHASSTLDTVPPTAALAPLPEYTNVATLVTNGSAADDRSGIASATLRVDGGASATNLTVGADGAVRGTLSLTEGSQRLVLSVVDRAGNVGATSTDITLDTIAPAIAILSPSANQAFGATTVGVTASVEDATPTSIRFGSLQFNLDGHGLATGVVDVGSEGPNTIVVEATDAAGNHSSANVGVVIDLTAPLATFDIGVADGTIIGRQPNDALLYTLHVDDITDATMHSSWGETHVFAAADGGGVLQGIVPLRSGHNFFAVTLVDAVGHETIVARTVTYDVMAPQPVFTGLLATAGSPVRGTVELSADAVDDLSGVAGATFEIEGSQTPATQSGGSFAAAIDTSTLGDGPHTVRAHFTDRVGNTATIESSLLVDNTAPGVAVTAPTAGAWVRQTITLSASATDATSGVAGLEIAVNGNRVGACSSSPCNVQFDTATLANGAFLVSATTYDRAGNRASADSSAKADNTSPSKFLVSPLDGAALSGTATVTVNVVDDAFESVECFVDGASLGRSTNPAFTASVDLLTKLDGPVVVSCSARDLAGNVGTESATIRVKNWKLELDPTTLNLKSEGNEVQLEIVGGNLDLLLPATDKALSLVVPGGSPAALVAKRGGYQIETSDGQRVLKLKFDRKALVASIKAGIAAGAIDASKPVNVRFMSASRDLGSVQLRVQGAK